MLSLAVRKTIFSDESLQTTFFPEAPSHTDKTPTNRLSNNHPIHRWANFIAGYSPELVSTAIAGAKLCRGTTILDPFAGLGTTLVQGLIEGLHVIGAEANPYFADIAHAKCLAVTENANCDAVFERLRELPPADDDAMASYSEDSLKFLRKLFPEESLRRLVTARNHESKLPPSLRPLYRLVVSCMLEELSSSQTDGVYKAPATLKRPKTYDHAFRMIELMVRTDAALLRKIDGATVQLHKGTALALTAEKFGHADLCITSPPYLNNFDYMEMSRMELYFWGYASSWGDITRKFRSVQVPNTTTIPTETKKNHLSYRETLSSDVTTRLDPVVAALEKARKDKGGSKDYNTLVYPYFATMQRIFEGCKKMLRPGAPIHVIIGDAYLYGTHIPTGVVMRQLLQELGFESLEMKLLRTRGTRWILAKRGGAGTPIGEYEIYGKRA